MTTTVDEETLRSMEQSTRAIADMILPVLPPGVGFTLMLFTYGDGGWLTYLSTADRADMLRTLKDQIARLEREAPPQPVSHNDDAG